MDKFSTSGGSLVFKIGFTVNDVSVSNFTGRLRKGLASSVIAQILAAASSLLLIPLFLQAWGAEGYGRWLTISAFVSYLNLIDLGGQTYFGNLLSIAYVRGEREEFQKRLSEGVSLFISICGLIFIILTILLVWSPIQVPWVGRGLTSSEKIIAGCLGTSYLITIVGAVYIQPYKATGLFARGTMVGNLTRVLIFFALSISLYLKVKASSYAIIYLLCVIISSLFIVRDMRRSIPLCRNITISLTQAIKGKVHFKGSIYFWLMSISGMLNQEGVILVLSAICSPAAVALYSIHRTIAGLVRYPGSLLQSPLWPELSFLFGKGNYQELRSVALFAIKLVSLSSIVVSIAVISGIPVFYPVWTGRQLQLDMSLLTLFLIQGIFFAGWSSAGLVLMAANCHQKMALWSLGNAIVTIVGALLLVKPMGLVGVALASLVGDLACSALISPYLAAELLQVRVTEIYLAFLRIIFVSLPLITVVAILSFFLTGWALLKASCLFVSILLYPTLLLSLGKENITRIWQMFFLRFNFGGKM